MEICIVDDDKVYQLLMKKIIKKIDSSISIKAFYNGEDAYEYYKKTRCDCHVLLLDINMPQMDGWEFLKRLNDEQIEISQIYLATSSIAYSDIEKAKEYKSVKGYLTKPITKDKIIEITQQS